MVRSPLLIRWSIWEGVGKLRGRPKGGWEKGDSSTMMGSL